MLWFNHSNDSSGFEFEGTLDYFNSHNRRVLDPDLYPNVKFLNTVNYFCDSERCKYGEYSGLYYHDNDHLSSYGAQKMFNSISKIP
jgi:hypothetical protein